jgi:hypothetical protein
MALTDVPAAAVPGLSLRVTFGAVTVNVPLVAKRV